MPEGDTIYRTARTLSKALGGKTVTAFETRFAKLASLNDDKPVAGRTVEKVEAQGKWCLIYFSDDLILATHMLMSGSWHIYRVGEKWQRPHSQMRVVITCGNFQAVLFNAQVAEFYTAKSLARSAQIPKLGPNVLSEEFSVVAGVHALQEYAAQHPEAEVGVVLLNQRVMSGLGNIYKSEVAFAAGVNPFRKMRTLAPREMEKIVEVAQRYMRANIAEAASEGIVTYTGPRRTTPATGQNSKDHGARLWVYRRRGEECRRCGATIQMRKQGMQARSTYWCPECQPIVD